MLCSSLAAVLLLLSVVDGRPKNIGFVVAEDAIDSGPKLTEEETAQYQDISNLLQALQKEGVDIGKKELSIIVVHKYPQLYEKLAAYDNNLEELAAPTTKFIRDRSDQAQQYLANDIASPVGAAPYEAVALSEEEREVLLEYYEQLVELMRSSFSFFDNFNQMSLDPIFRQILVQWGITEEELMAVLEQI
uniref:DUF148 domain-containing protein n=1 Tax=Steinernema glaseri TaxID=37863 RepID=A0A1I8A412_9BILA